MFIATEDKTERWIFCSLFDTQTGLRYQLQLTSREFAPELNVVVDSALGSHGEYGHGICYKGVEALNFWKRLCPLVSGESSGMQAIWIRNIGKEVEAALNPAETISID